MKIMNFNYLKTTLKFAFILSIFISCGKKKTPPELTLLGDDVMVICLNESFIDPGIQSIDAYNTDISNLIDISGNLDSGTVGSYKITYTSTDENDNVSTVERTVNVEICVSSLLSSYNVSHDCQLLGQDIINNTQSIIEGNATYELIIDDFNTFISQITGTIDGNNLTIPQNVFSVGIAPLSFDVTISGSGTINNTGDEIIINYTYDAGLAGSGTCTATYTK
tara:strand:+ start:105 stop:770 length:666 start_codon:yes stop_codon:yes gene_type:complete